MGTIGRATGCKLHQVRRSASFACHSTRADSSAAGGAIARIVRARLDPGSEVARHLVGKPRRVLGHLHALFTMLDHQDEETVVRFPRFDRRPRVTPFEQALAGIDSQTPLMLARAMAGVAMGRQNGTDLRLEKRALIGNVARGIARRGRRAGEQAQGRRRKPTERTTRRGGCG